MLQTMGFKFVIYLTFLKLFLQLFCFSHFAFYIVLYLFHSRTHHSHLASFTSEGYAWTFPRKLANLSVWQRPSGTESWMGVFIIYLLLVYYLVILSYSSSWYPKKFLKTFSEYNLPLDRKIYTFDNRWCYLGLRLMILRKTRHQNPLISHTKSMLESAFEHRKKRAW